ncbi:MAG: helix-turn-helix transcriptional regulator [Clostridiales bacterium]|nr:helix-turn-helix transcriptional regulator [Clostridiales bacterium]
MKIGNIIKYGLFNSRKERARFIKTPPRNIEYFEFDYLLSCDKDATSYIDNDSRRLSPNMLIVRKPEQVSCSKLHFKCYCLHLQIEKDSPFFETLSALPNYFSFINEHTYKPLFETLFAHIVKTNVLDDWFISAKLLELFYHLDKDARRNQHVSKDSPQTKNRPIQQAVAYMKAHFEQKISLQTLGALTGYTPNHFQKLFTDVMEITPQKYLEKVRIQNAKYLLSQTEQPIAEIAYACGFSSQAYFSMIFKRETLLTPNEFRISTGFTYEEN